MCDNEQESIFDKIHKRIQEDKKENEVKHLEAKKKRSEAFLREVQEQDTFKKYRPRNSYKRGPYNRGK